MHLKPMKSFVSLVVILVSFLSSCSADVLMPRDDTGRVASTTGAGSGGNGQEVNGFVEWAGKVRERRANINPRDCRLTLRMDSDDVVWAQIIYRTRDGATTQEIPVSFFQSSSETDFYSDWTGEETASEVRLVGLVDTSGNRGLDPNRFQELYDAFTLEQFTEIVFSSVSPSEFLQSLKDSRDGLVNSTKALETVLESTVFYRHGTHVHSTLCEGFEFVKNPPEI